VMALRVDSPPSRLGHLMFVYSDLDDRYCVAVTRSRELFQSSCADDLRIRYAPVVDLCFGFGKVFGLIDICNCALRLVARLLSSGWDMLSVQ